MATLRVLAVFTFATGAGALALQVQDDILTAHNLTICNAFVDARPLSMYTLSNKAKLTEEPLEYKACKTLRAELADGERIDFKLGGLSVGTFHAVGAPKYPASLLLVPRRKSNGTLAAVFESHMFTNTEKPQVAAIDAFGGTEEGTMVIKAYDSKYRNMEQAEMTLKTNSVLELAVGSPFSVSLKDARGKDISSSALRLFEGSKHVVMRVGSDSQELVVFSSTEGSAARSGSLRAALGATAAAAAALFAFVA